MTDDADGWPDDDEWLRTQLRAAFVQRRIQEAQLRRAMSILRPHLALIPLYREQ